MQEQGGRVPPETSDREIFADLPGKKRGGKKGKWVKIEKKGIKIVKGKVENGKWKVEKLQNNERPLLQHFVQDCSNHGSENDISITSFKLLAIVINGWQLAKMKKSIPDMSLP